MRFPFGFLCAFIMISGSARAAGDWYAGAEVGHTDLRFKPRYRTLNGGGDFVFVDRAEGTQWGVFGGKRFSLGDRAAVCVQGRLGFTGTEFNLSIPEEPAQLQYGLPWTATVSVAPQVRMGDGPVWLFAEGGFGLGEVEERKIAPITTSYDESPVQLVTTIGGGVKVAIGKKVEAYGMYRYTSWSSFTYTAYLPSGLPGEVVTDKPHASSWLFGGLTRF
jgi:opacity protein-like surface antigen